MDRLRHPLSSAGILAILSLAAAQPAPAQILARNLLYTSIQPCRVIDTRLAFTGRLIHATPQFFNVVGPQNGNNFSAQGGNASGCGLPAFDTDGIPQVQAVMFNFVAVGANGAGDLVAWPSDQSKPLASILNYANAASLGFLNIANGIILPVQQTTQGAADITVLSQVADTHLVADIVGYFSAGGAVSNGAPFNLFLGLYAGNPTGGTGKGNTALGFAALEFNTSGTYNTAVGVDALQGNTVSGGNTAVGASALQSSGGLSNVAIGASALINSTSGNGNTGVGAGALSNVTGGSGNAALGDAAGANIVSGFYNIDIGFATGGFGDESNTIRIGSQGQQTATYIAGISGATSSGGTAVYVNSDGLLGTATSSLRFKEDVEDMGEASTDLMRLRPVTFHYKDAYDDGSHLLQYGLIAEEVAKIYPDLVQFDQDGRPFSVRYHFVNAMLLNEVQKQHAEIERQSAGISTQAAELASQRAQLAQERRLAATQQARIGELEKVQAAERREIDQLRREVSALMAPIRGTSANASARPGPAPPSPASPAAVPSPPASAAIPPPAD